MTGVGNRNHLGARDFLPKDICVHRRDEPILLTPHDERRRFDSPQAALEPAFRNREEELCDGTETARHADQRFDLFLRAIILVAEKLGKS